MDWRTKKYIKNEFSKIMRDFIQSVLKVARQTDIFRVIKDISHQHFHISQNNTTDDFSAPRRNLIHMTVTRERLDLRAITTR